MKGIKQAEVYCICLLCLKYLRWIHWFCSLLFIDSSIFWCAYTRDLLFLSPFSRRRTWNFFVWDYDKLALNIHMQVFLWTYIYPFMSGIAVAYGKCTFNFTMNFQIVFQSAFTPRVWVLPGLYILTNSW